MSPELSSALLTPRSRTFVSPRQHMRNCTLTGNQLFQDILSYGPSLIGCSESSADQDVSTATGQPTSCFLLMAVRQPCDWLKDAVVG